MEAFLDLSLTPPKKSRSCIAIVEIMPSPEVRYSSLHTPIGRLHIAVTNRGVCMLEIGVRVPDFRRVLEKRFGVRAARRDEELLPHVEQLHQYFKGRRTVFTGPFDLRGTAFQLKVWKQLLRIPYGEVRTYGEVADLMGMPRACRAVGGANGANIVPIMIPCHRVVASGMKIGGYGLGVGLKRRLLELEGYPVATLR